jgi:hypothetical protein
MQGKTNYRYETMEDVCGNKMKVKVFNTIDNKRTKVFDSDSPSINSLLLEACKEAVKVLRKTNKVDVPNWLDDELNGICNGLQSAIKKAKGK